MNATKYAQYLTVRFPNHYTRHYERHVQDGNIRHRKALVRMKLSRWSELSQGYFTVRSLELMADYLLADDHVRGLRRKRDAVEEAGLDDEYPPLGEGAREFHIREWEVGAPITVGERRKVKTCEVCDSPFIGRHNARVCGDTCRATKDRLRKREEYNEKALGIASEKRLKRDRLRQDLEYPFYSPLEIYELINRSERATDDAKLEHHLFRQSEDADTEKYRLNGRRKPMYVGRDEFSKEEFNYRPRGREAQENDMESRNGVVVSRKIGVDVTLEELEKEKFENADKMRGLTRLKPKSDKGSRSFTSEKTAI